MTLIEYLEEYIPQLEKHSDRTICMKSNIPNKDWAAIHSQGSLMTLKLIRDAVDRGYIDGI